MFVPLNMIQLIEGSKISQQTLVEHILLKYFGKV